MKPLNIIGLGFIMGSVLLNGLMGSISEAQPSKTPPMPPFSQSQPMGACRKDPSISFSGDQAKKFENLQHSFFLEVKPLWGELRDLRFEMRYSVSGSQMQPQFLLEKQMKISAIHAKIENLRFAYMIKARSIFTKEQLERFPADCPLKMATGYWDRKGHGKGSSKWTLPLGR